MKNGVIEQIIRSELKSQMNVRTSKMASVVTNTYTIIEKLYIPYIDIVYLFLAADGFVLSKFDKGKGVTFRFNAFFALPGVMTGIWGNKNG